MLHSHAKHATFLHINVCIRPSASLIAPDTRGSMELWDIKIQHLWISAFDLREKSALCICSVRKPLDSDALETIAAKYPSIPSSV